MFNQSKKLNIFLFSIIVVFSLVNIIIPTQVLAQSEELYQDQVQDEMRPDIAKVLTDTEVFSVEDDHKLGSILKDSIVYISSIIEDKAYFQWDSKLAWIPLEEIEIISLESLKENDVPFSEQLKNTSKLIKSTQSIIVFDSENLDVQIGTIELGESYSINLEKEKSYEITIGNRIAYINKENTILIDKEAPIIEETIVPEVPESQQEVVDTQEVATEQPVEVEKTTEIEKVELAKTESIQQSESKTQVTTPLTFGKYIIAKTNIPVYRSNSSVVIAELKAGEEYLRVRDLGDWHEVKVGNEYGLVYKGGTVPGNGDTVTNLDKGSSSNGRYFFTTTEMVIYDTSVTPRKPFVTVREGVRFPILGEDQNWYKVDFGGRVGYINKWGTRAEFISSDKYFKVRPWNLVVYRPNSNIVIAELAAGEEFERLSDYGDWHLIKVGNEHGLVFEGGTEPSTGNSITNHNNGRNNTGKTFETLADTIVYDTSVSPRKAFAFIKKGVKYPIISEDPYWFAVDVNGRIGYVNKSGTKVGFTSSDKYFKVTSPNLSVYRANTSIVIAELSEGEEYLRLKDLGDWHQVRIGNEYGLVYEGGTQPSLGTSIKNASKSEATTGRSFEVVSDIVVYDTSVSPKKPYVTLKKGVKYPFISEDPNWFKVDIAGRVGFINKSATKMDFIASDKYFKVTTDNLSVFVNRGKDSVEVAKLKLGEEYVRVRDYWDWHQVKVGNELGFVWKASTQPSLGTTIDKKSNDAKPLDVQFLAENDISVISGSKQQLGTIKSGEKYPVLKIHADHYEIDFLGTSGLVYKSEVKIGPIIRYTHYDRTIQEMLDLQMALVPQTDLYRNEPAYVSGEYLKINGSYGTLINTTALNVRSGPGTNHPVVGKLYKSDNGNEALIYESVGNGWYRIGLTWRNARAEDTLKYLNPDRYGRDTVEFYQYLVLDEPAGVNVDEVNGNILSNKGVLTGMGQAFVDAAYTYNVNEIYLMAHALHETGNGTSRLAKGIVVSEVNGEPVPPRTVYNMYGIDAKDSCAERCGSEYAYSQGWFTPEAAIIGGAKFIGNGYVNSDYYKQDTLYKMKWNPGSPNLLKEPHQYATDIAWATKQVKRISDLYNLINSYTLIFDVPVYKK
ncbi:SH3 domain-containing protein [Ferdinandcohnia sp. Marseille-Q9671]